MRIGVEGRITGAKRHVVSSFETVDFVIGIDVFVELHMVKLLRFVAVEI